ncbi:unnamed protein product [Thlaspi arvense]|uniref:Peptidase A1 domain-containing protein n=1 Tax=Thlaspi arvense TaxID=13288 RepID=A0AAU9SXM3_THLAR|nr:unnamed protein product [Thlaspi arvense]
MITIQVSSLFPSSSSCDLPSKASKAKSSLRVVHRQGPCSRLSSGKTMSIDHDEILRLDQARVNSIHSKLSKKVKDQVMQSKSAVLPAIDRSTHGSGNYVVTVGIGTPMHNQSLIFDTGSDLTWTQCKPCLTCFPQVEPIFNPFSSSSYANISCSSPVCASAGLLGNCSESSTCLYYIEYGDGSSSNGFFATEKFTLTTSDVFHGVKFGCGDDNEGQFLGAAGLLGLSRGNLSFPWQTKNTYNNFFSYCLPSSPGYIGDLTFGSAGISNDVKYTPIFPYPDPSLYGLDIEGITVGGQKLDIPLNVFSTPGAIIDSGTVISRLPSKAYEALRTAFKAKMRNYTAAPGNKFLDTCYDFTNSKTVHIPTISFSFSGGTVVTLDPKGVLYPSNTPKVFCLAFAENEYDIFFAIFGNVQQKTLQVVYDVAGGRIGFAPNGCN